MALIMPALLHAPTEPRVQMQAQPMSEPVKIKRGTEILQPNPLAPGIFIIGELLELLEMRKN